MNRIAKACAAISVFVVLLAGPLAFAQSTPPQPVQQLTVWDSRGRMVGNVIGFGANFGTFAIHAAVAFRVNSALAVVGFGPQGFVDIGPGNTIGLFFTTVDCTGDGYRDPNEVIAPSLVTLTLARGNKVFLQAGSAAEPVLIRSAFADTSGLVCIPNEFVTPMPMIPMRLLTELSAAFTPPFTLR